MDGNHEGKRRPLQGQLFRNGERHAAVIETTGTGDPKVYPQRNQCVDLPQAQI